MEKEQIAKKCKSILRKYYGSKFKGVILYGSVARGQSNAQSDIDLLILLEKPFQFFRELRKITELLSPVQMQSKSLISAKPAAVDDFENGVIQLYRNVRKEGIVL